MVEAASTGDSPTVQRLAPMVSKLRKELMAELERRNIHLHVDDVVGVEREFAQDVAKVAWELFTDQQADEFVRRVTELRRAREENIQEAVEA